MPQSPDAAGRRFTDAAAAADAVTELARHREPRAGPARVLAVDGPSGAGKSSFARDLAARSPQARIVRLDDVYPGWDGLEEGVRRVVDGVLVPFARGLPARLRRYDWDRGRDGVEYDVPSAPIIVLEGCGAGATACAPFLSALVWLDAPEPVRFARAMARDGEGFRPHWDRWAAQERAHFGREDTCERADLWLDTSATTWRTSRNAP